MLVTMQKTHAVASMPDVLLYDDNNLAMQYHSVIEGLCTAYQVTQKIVVKLANLKPCVVNNNHPVKIQDFSILNISYSKLFLVSVPLTNYCGQV